MIASSRVGAGWLGVGGLVVALAGSRPAIAQVTQADAIKTPLPQPVGAAERALVNDSWAWNANTMVNRNPQGMNLNPAVRYGDFYAPPSYPQFVTGDAINLSGLFKWRKEAIDPIADAKTGPGYFSAKCGFTAELLLMGSNCQAQFGWYNVTDPTSKTAPAAAEIYPFMTGKPQDQLKCVEADGTIRKTDGFCPLAWDNRHPYDLSVTRWTPKAFSSGDISKDPRYKGGYVAFAMIGDPQRCPQNKYSMYEHNQPNASGVPWVTTLLYHSTVDSSGFYLAFEDLPMSAADWKKSADGKAGADGDFNDLVYYVSGLTCAGGNQPCRTGQFGACAIGHTDCAAAGESAVCRPSAPASGELCDNVDNDCDGVVDDGQGICPDASKPVCFLGACVGSCTSGEFPCPLGFTCDTTGACVDPTCATLSCQPGSTCKNGACIANPCAGVACPYPMQCELGRCVDPCAGVTCSSGRVCDRGRCVAACSCAGCDNGLTCGVDGRCTDSACAGKACPTGTICQHGACNDPCAGVVCPGNGVCAAGTCYAPISGAGGSAGGGVLNFGGSSSAGAGLGGMADVGYESAGATSSGGAAGDDSGEGDAGSATASGAMTGQGGAKATDGPIAAGGAEVQAAAPPQKSSSCGFSGLARTQPALPWLGLALGLGFMRRRRTPRR